MKFATAYYLMLIYVTVMIKPLIPMGLDMWAHEFNEIEHLSCVHAKYGSNHLEKQVKADFSNEKNKSQSCSRIDDPTPFYTIIERSDIGLAADSSSLTHPSLTNNDVAEVYLSRQGQPPQLP